MVPICCGLVFLQPLLRAHARVRHLIGPRSSRSCCQPTPLQRTASLAGRAPCGRGRRTPSASARGQRSTTSAWIAPTCVVSVVSLCQAGGPSTARGIAGSPRKQEDEATPAHKGPGAIVSSREEDLSLWDEKVLSTRYLKRSTSRSVCSPKSGLPRRGGPPHKGACVFILGTAPDLVAQK